MKSRTAAISRSQVARQAKPLGELVKRMSEAKAEGKDPYSVIPPLPMPKSRKRVKTQPETALVRKCLEWLAAHHIFAWRNNSGTLWVNGRPITYGYVGSSDILGLLHTGRFLAVECKLAKKKQSPAQKRFQQKIEANNGLYLLVYSVQELERGINDCRHVNTIIER